MGQDFHEGLFEERMRHLSKALRVGGALGRTNGICSPALEIILKEAAIKQGSTSLTRCFAVSRLAVEQLSGEWLRVAGLSAVSQTCSNQSRSRQLHMQPLAV